MPATAQTQLAHPSGGRAASQQLTNIDFQISDIRERSLPEEYFDCIASIATLHHLPIEEMLLKVKAALKPGGVLLILDLFEPARISDSLVARSSGSRVAGFSELLVAGLSDSLLKLLAIPVSVALGLIHHGRFVPRRAEPAAWSAHERCDTYPTMSEVHILCTRLLPGAKIKKHLLWRYSIVWKKAE